LNDEKIICHPRLKLVKKKMPGLAPGIFIWKRLDLEASSKRPGQSRLIEDYQGGKST